MPGAGRAADQAEAAGSSQTRSASGAPSQQFAFMWQCGQSQRVEMGSKG
jgi:hypothetical protein